AGEVRVLAAAGPSDGRRRELRFAVRDTGIGIPADRLERLFQPFSQADSSISRQYGGTGLGLVISRRLAELMGGGLCVESAPGQGSTFSFSVLVEPAPGRVAGEPVHPRPELMGRRVLVVAGHELNRRAVQDRAAVWGMRASAAASAGEAMALLQTGARFDGAVIDLRTPGQDGWTLLERLEELPEDRRPNVVVMAPFGFRWQGPLPPRVRALLAKPLKLAQIDRALAELFGAGPADVPAAVEPAAAGDGGALRILLAEDNVINQRVALKMLERLGYRADLAGNGLEVLEALARQPYDLVLMDVQMPQLDGLETTRRIRARWPGPAGPTIIAMTANAMRGDREQCLAAGMDGYIAKPVDREELRAALANPRLRWRLGIHID
ncbi:MAG: response regulator, partial [Chromatiaceae bacterium]|nr:response regulator [Candidatus Thioaporhodococcus sediminis]